MKAEKQLNKKASYQEIDFEDAIEEVFIHKHAYTKTLSNEFDQRTCLHHKSLLDFVRLTQAENWEKFEKFQGEHSEKTFIQELDKAINNQGLLNVLRHGFKCFGTEFFVAYFKPANSLNKKTMNNYLKNILQVTRQFEFESSSKKSKSIDMVLSLNGIPVLTMELKNPMTSQNVDHGMKQYKQRNPRELIFQFNKRALVHFVIDPNLCYMTTKVNKDKTQFLPFNLGCNHGAGNPPCENSYKTSYLWEKVLAKDSFLEILGKFIQLERKEIKMPEGNIEKKETIIFPRFHQLDAVSKLINSVLKKERDTYLIQHSAGSGKSNTIAWLAHRLSSLHTEDNEKVFDSVIVVTDRVVLDRQLQEAIYQFDHKQGVVQKIDQKSSQLGEALSKGKPIIITTIQKFPFIQKEAKENKKYAVIIDEAHSSQSGERVSGMKEVLGELEDNQDLILKSVQKRGKQKNITHFAFTATPKAKTLALFGNKDKEGKPCPFHLYSMRQAIEEAFILDVLKNYTTYKSYFNLLQKSSSDPEVFKNEATKTLARFISIHPTNISQKTEIIIKHFMTHTRHQIGGKAKAMVVTSSRLHAVRYKESIEKYIKENSLDLKALVAFSGKVIDPDLNEKTYTENEMNEGVKNIPKAFKTNNYQVLIVANKYQTGFNEPLLHTMYVDKKLDGIHAVQTLSRLNRIHKGKEGTFVLDFVNNHEDIKKAFQPYYEQTSLDENVDHSRLEKLKNQLEAYHIYHREDVEEFSKVFFKKKENQDTKDHFKMNQIVNLAVARYNEADEKTKKEFKHGLVSFKNLYGFLSQIIPYHDTELEKVYTYFKKLLNVLPKDSSVHYNFDEDVELKHYRIKMISQGSIQLNKHELGIVHSPSHSGSVSKEKEMAKLSSLIDILNDRFGTNFKSADGLFLESVQEEVTQNEELIQTLKVNSKENAKIGFKKELAGVFLDRMEQNEEILDRFTTDQAFKKVIEDFFFAEVLKTIESKRKKGFLKSSIRLVSFFYCFS